MNRAPLVHLTLALAALVALGGGYAFLYTGVERVNGEIAETLAKVQAKEGERARTASARSALAELASEEAFIQEHFVKKENIVSFLEQLESAGRTLGANVSVASVSDSAASTDGRISVSLSIEGPFDAVMRTLGAIEHGPYAIAVDTVTLNTSGDGVWTAVGSFSIGTLIGSSTP